ncbi:hypothetical protein F5876DRAFT_66045 [Lentinula aff. lateritia]|uniref:Uncharacterized protein n=1 Tax=Lentinula aff. lateritia TaxID=2804960 RepID=A0ACC1TZD7_9AGAR|nr:hypothetical protein F5876DRAFT_66045 [Lentinula aff. lateritia]
MNRHATSIAQLEQRNFTYNFCLHRSKNGKTVKAKTSAEFRLSGAEEDWMITFGTAIGYKSKQVGHAHSGVCELEKVIAKGIFWGFSTLKQGWRKLYRVINEVISAAKFKVLTYCSTYFIKSERSNPP